MKQRGAWVPRVWLDDEQRANLWNSKRVKDWGVLNNAGVFRPRTTPWNDRELDESQTGECVVYKVGGHGDALTDLPEELRVRQQWERA